MFGQKERFFEKMEGKVISLSLSLKRSTHGLPLPWLIFSFQSSSLFLLSISLSIFFFLTPNLYLKTPFIFLSSPFFLTSSQKHCLSFPVATTPQKFSHHPAPRYSFVFFSYMLQPLPWQDSHIFCHTSQQLLLRSRPPLLK